MTEKKNQGSKKSKKIKQNLSDIVKNEMVGKRQIPGRLKQGQNFCISGLLINHFAPDIDIENVSWQGITELVMRYPKYFSEDHFASDYSYDSGAIKKYVHDFKQYYQDTGRINLRTLASINDHSFAAGNPFTFEMFANLFQEIGIKIENLNPIAKYKEDTVLNLDRVKIEEEDKPKSSLEAPPLSTYNPFGNTIFNVQNMNVNLDPEFVSKVLSKYVENMLTEERLVPSTFSKPSTPWKTLVKTADTKNE